MCGVLGLAAAVRPGAHRPAAVDAVHMQRVIEARAEGGGRQGVADEARRDDLSRPQRVRGGERQFPQVVGKSTPVAGSSSSSSRGEDISARAISTRPRSPCDIVGQRVCSCPVMPMRTSSCSARRMSSRLGVKRGG